MGCSSRENQHVSSMQRDFDSGAGIKVSSCGAEEESRCALKYAYIITISHLV